MLSLSDLDVGITMGEFLMGCFFVAVVWRLVVGGRDKGPTRFGAPGVAGFIG